MTLYLKRLRKHLAITGALRYMYVVEPHASGFPHVHMLIVQLKGTPLTKRRLDATWGYGFTLWRLIADAKEGKVAAYCAKYAGKNNVRIRASIRFGAPATSSSPQIAQPMLKGATEERREGLMTPSTLYATEERLSDFPPEESADMVLDGLKRKHGPLF